MLASHYAEIRLLHVCSVVLSGIVFTVRGCLRIGNIALANHPALRLLSHATDTMLLVAAILLTLILHQYPFVNGWLTTKVLLLVVYVALGTLALRRARTSQGRAAAMLGALAVFAYIVGVAIAHDPRGLFLLLHR